MTLQVKEIQYNENLRIYNMSKYIYSKGKISN